LARITAPLPKSDVMLQNAAGNIIPSRDIVSQIVAYEPEPFFPLLDWGCSESFRVHMVDDDDRHHHHTTHLFEPWRLEMAFVLQKKRRRACHYYGVRRQYVLVGSSDQVLRRPLTFSASMIAIARRSKLLEF
jgi:hypothetical protein